MSSVFPKLCTFCESVEITRQKGGDEGTFFKNPPPLLQLLFSLWLMYTTSTLLPFWECQCDHITMTNVTNVRMYLCVIQQWKSLNFHEMLFTGQLQQNYSTVFSSAIMVRSWLFGLFHETWNNFRKIILLVVSKERCQIKPKSKLRSLNPAGGLPYFFAH